MAARRIAAVVAVVTEAAAVAVTVAVAVANRRIAAAVARHRVLTRRHRRRASIAHAHLFRVEETLVADSFN